MMLRGAARCGALTIALYLLSSCTATPPPRPIAPPLPVEPVAGDWPRPEVLRLALQAFRCGLQEGRFERPILTVIDYSLPSNLARLWVIDLEQNQVLHHELVAHGEGSGGTVAVAFSNEMGSHQSSIGLFRADEPYTGQFGYSLRISGLEPGVNDRARERAIVMHGMEDVDPAFAAERGTIARSWGCPAIPRNDASRVIDSISGGSAIFAYYPDAQWLNGSHYLHCGMEPADVAADQRGADVPAEPVAADVVADPAAGDVVAEPVAGDVVAEPVASDVATEPVAGDIAAEPVAGDLAAEPVADDVVAEPVAGDVAAEPVAGDVIAEPAAGDVVAEPDAGDLAAEPAAGDVVAEPAAGDVVAEPAAGDVVAEPAAGVAADQVARVAAEQP